MANKTPLAMYNGKPAQMQAGDVIPQSIIEKVAVVAANITGTYAIDLANGKREFNLTATGDCVLSVSNVSIGDIFKIRLKPQSHTITLFTTITWLLTTGAPTLPTGANDVIVLVFEVTDTDTYDGYVAGRTA